MLNNEEQLRELAERIYDLDAEVYAQLGSSLGRVFNRNRESCVDELVNTMLTRPQGHLMRSELALIANMARTIKDKEERKLVMTEYNRILQEVMSLPTSFVSGDIIDPEMAKLNAFNLQDRFSSEDHLIICISWTYGCGGIDVGFKLADKLKINYYDAEIFEAVLKRLEAEKDTVRDSIGYSSNPDLNPNLASAFELCDMARKEDFIIMGRCGDAIMTNNRIPHISIYITAPFEQRVRHTMEIHNGMGEKKARRLLKHLDRQHSHYYNFYTSRRWGNANNYDLCINSASYGIDGTVEFILRMIDRGVKNKK